MVEGVEVILGARNDPLYGPILVVGSGGRPAMSGVRQIEDRVPGCGPMGGLDAALQSHRHPDADR